MKKQIEYKKVQCILHNYREIISLHDKWGPIFAKPIRFICTYCGHVIKPYEKVD